MKFLKSKNNQLMRYMNERSNEIALSGISVKTDWYILLGATLIIFVFLITSSFNFYNSVETELMGSESDGQQKTLTLNERKMRIVLDDLLERRSVSATKVSTPTVPDEDEIPVELIDGE